MGQIEHINGVIKQYRADWNKDPEVVKMSRESAEHLTKDVSGYQLSEDKTTIFGIPVEFVDGMAFGDFVVS